MSNRKLQFQQDWLASNWDKFVAEGVEDSHGRLLTVSDALELTRLEGDQIDAASAWGPAPLTKLSRLSPRHSCWMW
jgi:hypothetical protein